MIKSQHVLVTLIAACGLVSVGFAAAPANIKEWADAYAKPTLTGVAYEAKGKDLTWGHFTLSFTSGRLYPVTAGEKIVGAFFFGVGKFTYTSADPKEAQTYQTNLERVSPWKADPSGMIGDKIREALIMLTPGADTLVDGTPLGEGVVPVIAEVFEKHLENFANDQTLRFVQLMPMAQLERPEKPVVMVEVVADNRDIHYIYDPLRDRDESILVVHKTAKHSDYFEEDQRYPEQILSQPIGRKWLDPKPRGYILTAIDLLVVNPNEIRAEIEVTETYRALTPIRVLALDLRSYMFGNQGPNARLVRNSYALESASFTDGKLASFSHFQNELLVELPRQLNAGESVTLRFRIRGNVLFHPGNDNYWELGSTSWYPKPSRWDMNYATYHAIVKVKKPFVPFSCGQTVKRWEEGDMACAEFSESKPIGFIVVLAGKYTTVSEERRGITIRVSAYAFDQEKASKRLINLAFGFMDFYRTYLGEYPFKELNIIEINEYGFGQAPPGVIRITKEAFTPTFEEEARVYSQGINGRVAHEIAHTWWGDVVMLSKPEDQWLSESTAEYISAYAIGQIWKKSKFDGSIESWLRSSRFSNDKGSIYLANYLSGDKAWRDRVALLYAKGPLVLHALRQEVGDKAFFTILKSYITNFNFKYADTGQFIALTNFVTKKDCTEWFNRYLFGIENPKI